MKMPEPMAWTLTEELSKRETTTRAHLWFTNPVNCMWTPLYEKQALIDLLDAAAAECEALTQSTPNGFTLEQKITFSKPSQEITLAIAAIRKLKEKL